MDFARLVDRENGIVANEVFSDSEVYRHEQKQVFGRCWLFVGHESMIPERGDYITNYMGEDAVIVCRDMTGNVRVLLNKCRHRGNKVCMYDRGNAKTFTCSFHGWTYDIDGKLSGVPHKRSAYFNDLDLDSHGLVPVPKVATYGGLIFANWDAGAVSLDDYLGEMRWYLDNFLTADFAGGMEIIPGIQRYRMPVNWKLLAENFAGDAYHFLVTHASVVKVMTQGQEGKLIDSGPGAQIVSDKLLSVGLNYQKGAPHGIFELHFGPAQYERDMAQAQALGRESVEWLKEKYRKLQERMKWEGEKPYSFHVGNIFPNFSMIGPGSQLYGRGLLLMMPRGPNMTEVWQWCAVDREAPKPLKERMIYVLMHRQAATGLVAADDHENFARITENLSTPNAIQAPLHYAMGLGHEAEYPFADDWRRAECPGTPTGNFSEMNQRELYRYWSDLMGAT